MATSRDKTAEHQSKTKKLKCRHEHIKRFINTLMMPVV
jgi:hypothetical protein